MKLVKGFSIKALLVAISKNRTMVFIHEILCIVTQHKVIYVAWTNMSALFVTTLEYFCLSYTDCCTLVKLWILVLDFCYTACSFGHVSNI